VWVETELAGGPVDESAREDPVERRLRRERLPHRRLVRGGLRRRDQRLGSPGRSQHCGLDGRRRREAGTRHPPNELQLVPRSPRAAEQRRRPDRSPLRREAPLHDRVDLGQSRTWVAEQTAQDRGACCEREIRDDCEGLVGQREQRRITLDHLDSGIGAEASPQLSYGRRVELDRAHSGSRVRERARESTVAGAEVERERARPDAGVADELVCEGATTKGVATAWPRLR
jgi:hypothetical protein